jgi:NAD(P)-dependent dehydrogenase (short-subunit alcohol dehydrogenase family)
MMGQLQDKVAIVTGASSGIGLAIAEAYAAEGAMVVLAARNRQKLASAVESIAERGGKALAVPTDVAVEKDVLELFGRTLAAHDRVDILINNAGIATRSPTDELTLEAWRRVLDVNVTGPFLCSREALKIMKRQKGGRIINIGSISAKVPRANSAPYTTTKFALEGLTRSLALDGRTHGIAVSIIHPGNTLTALWQGREEMARKEGIMEARELARIAVLIATLPPETNLLESVVLPVAQPFLGRG